MAGRLFAGQNMSAAFKALAIGLGLGSLLACASPTSPTSATSATLASEAVNAYPATPLADLVPAPYNATQVRAQRRLVLALAYFEQGQHEVAMQEVRAALQIDPQHAGAYNLLGLLHQRNNALALAQHSFETSAHWAQRQGNSNDLADAQHNLGGLLCAQAQYPRALAQFVHALSQPNYQQPSKTHLAAGLCHLRAGNPDAARDSWQRSLSIDPRNPNTRYQLALLDWQSRPEHAQALLAPIHAQQQGNAHSLWLAVRVAHALQQPNEVQHWGQQLQQRYPESAQAQAWIQRKFDQP